MSYKVSMTTKINVTADTAEEAAQIYHYVTRELPVWGQPGQDVPALEGEKVALAEPSPTIPLEHEQQGRTTPLPPGQTSEAERPAPALQGAIAAYLKELAVTGRSARTVELYRSILGSLATKLGPERRVQSIANADVTVYLEGMKNRGLSQAYIHLVARTMRLLFAWLVKRGVIQISPMAGMEFRRPRSQPVPPFSDDEIRRLLEATASTMQRAIVTLLLDTGMRASELTGLTPEAIDSERGLIRVRGKGDKAREVALNGEPQQALEAYLVDRGHHDGPLWPESFDRKSLGNLLNALSKRAGVKRVFPHRFRHTFASRFLRETGNPLALQALMGHTSLVMVQRYIAAAQAEIALEAHRRYSPMAGL